jgi:hypothetical protein
MHPRGFFSELRRRRVFNLSRRFPMPCFSRLVGLTTALVLMHLGASPVAAQERESFPAAQPGVPATARDSVIAVVDESLRAMAANDVAASRRLMLPDGVEFSTRETPEGVRIQGKSNEAFLEWLAQNEDVMLERIWDPTVQVHGTIATLWAPYDFYVNGTFSHCGVNAIQLIRTDDGWRIANWIWTVEPEGCAPSPLGPLQESE